MDNFDANLKEVKTTEELIKDVQDKAYALGFSAGKEHMAYRACQIWRQMKTKKSLAGNLWHSDDEIEEAIEKEALK